MLIECPHCGEKIVLYGLGRKALNIPLINVYDALCLYRSVGGAAIELGCSRAYIYKVLKNKRLTPADVVFGRVIKQEFVSIPL
jgi:hypothetical protein